MRIVGSKTSAAILAMMLLLTACGDATVITPTRYSQLGGWTVDNHAEALRVFVDSCAVNAKRSSPYRAREEGAIGELAHWREVCAEAAEIDAPSDATAREFFERRFTPHRVTTEATDTGLHTGYYEPILAGSLTRKAPYLTPVYGVPGDLARRKPYFTREEIENGALKGRAPVLLYVADPVMLFFLHIQGSGKVKLPDGSLVGLQYAAQNGHEFVPIGRVLRERGDLPTPSMQGIRDWLNANPDERDAVMNTNPSYIFFKRSPGEEMAKGAMGIPLTPLRSIAVDDDRAAYGVPTYLDTFVTAVDSRAQQPLQRLFVSQDTGGALKGPHRADIFFGRGEQAEWQAGHQNARGKAYWLLPVAADTVLVDGLPKPADTMVDAVRDAVPTLP